MNKHPQAVEAFNNKCDKFIKKSRRERSIIRLCLGVITLLLVSLVAFYGVQPGMFFILLSMLLMANALRQTEHNIKATIGLRL